MCMLHFSLIRALCCYVSRHMVFPKAAVISCNSSLMCTYVVPFAVCRVCWLCVAADCVVFSDMSSFAQPLLTDYDLGKLQSGDRLGDVILPKWAATPEDFIATHRGALVSRRIEGANERGW